MADTIIKRVGGKVKLRDWIKSHLPAHNTYCEPFAGSFAVGLSLPRINESDYRTIFNDLDKNVFNLFQVLRDKGKEFLELLELTPYSREEFDRANEILRSNHDKDWDKFSDLERARLYLVSNRQSFAGKEDGTWCISRKGENICHTWKNLKPCAKMTIDNLRNAYIENDDYEKVISRHDGEETCFYIDPPYEDVEEDYYHINKEGGFNHVRLAEVVSKIKGTAVISYYDSEVIRKLYSYCTFETKEVVKHMQLQQGDEEKSKGTEILCIKHNPYSEKAKAKLKNDMFA